MTDKQIIIDGVDVSKCKYFSKYQKIVRNNEVVVDIQNACVEEIETKPCWQEHNCYFKDWLRKEQECEELTSKCSQLKQTLAEIKEVLQLYNNTTIGTDKGNGIFEFEVSNDNVLGGKLICYYNTNPAREALRKINEVEDDKNM
jgi:hypothetical protein